MTFTRIAALAVTLTALLAGCSSATPEPEGPIGCVVTNESGTHAILLDLPDEFAESGPCTWTAGETYLSIASTTDPDLTDIDDQRAESESWIGIGGDEEVSDFSFDEGVELFAGETGETGDLLAYRSAADGVPIIVIVGQSADLQLSFSASADGSDVATELERFRSIAATLEVAN
jgi:hypothetical protein